MDDDNLYLAYVAQSEVARATPLEQSLIDRITAVPGCEESVFRFSLRERYSTNYAGYAAVQRAVQAVAAVFVPAGPPRIVTAALVTKALFLLLLTVALGVAACRGASREIEAAVICAFITLVALEMATRWVPTSTRVDITVLQRTIAQQLSSFFVIARAHSYFEVTPRNGALLMFVIALVLKWQGQLTSALVAVLLIAPLHQTYGGLGLVLFAIASAVSRPDIFASSLRRVILVGTGLVYLVREHFFAHLGIGAQILSALGLALGVLLFFRVVGAARFAAFRARCLGSWVDREIALDGATLVICVMLVTLVSWGCAQLMQNAITRTYVWANLAVRTMSFVRFPAFAAAFWLLLSRVRWLASERGRSWFVAISALSCVLLSWVNASHVDAHAWGRLRGEVEKGLSRPRDLRIFDPRVEENRTYAYLTMVAAGQVEPAAAEASILADREIRCSRP